MISLLKIFLSTWLLSALYEIVPHIIFIVALSKSSIDGFPSQCPDKAAYLGIVKMYDSDSFGGTEASVDKLVAMVAV